MDTATQGHASAFCAGALEVRMTCHGQVPAVGAYVALVGLIGHHQFELYALDAIGAAEWPIPFGTADTEMF